MNQLALRSYIDQLRPINPKLAELLEQLIKDMELLDKRLKALGG